jgi:hypothetical protein
MPAEKRLPQMYREANEIGFEYFAARVAFGSMNASREYFETGVKGPSTAELQYLGWLKKLLTHRVTGRQKYTEIIRLLTET